MTKLTLSDIGSVTGLVTNGALYLKCYLLELLNLKSHQSREQSTSTLYPIAMLTSNIYQKEEMVLKEVIILITKKSNKANYLNEDPLKF